jgi:puromycin-sensitive aminopeptidase
MKAISATIAHEIAHQWFGNIVTMEWWDELWLNEGFATFAGTQAVNHFFPKWTVWNEFITQHTFEAFKVDSLKNSHPVEVPIVIAKTINEIFDTISYYKGASIIRMIENYLGEENFKKGLNIYINRFQYRNAVTKDLWDTLSEASGRDVPTIMDNWIRKIGYPIISVEETQETGKYKISQKRFLQIGEPNAAEDETIWYLNIGYLTESNPKEIIYVDLREKESVLNLDVKSSSEWIKVNAGQSGFFRVKYSPSLGDRLSLAIKELSVEDRLGIQNDALALATSRAIPLTQALNLIRNYDDETEYAIWLDISSNLEIIATLFEETEAEPYFNAFILKLYRKIGHSLGWAPIVGELDTNKELRSIVLKKLGIHGDVEVLQTARQKYEQFLSDPSSLSPDLRKLVYTLAMITGDDKEYEQLVNIYNNAKLPEERIIALMGIGSSKKSHLITKALNFSLSDAVRAQDKIYIFETCASLSRNGQEITWKFMKDNWKRILAQMEGSISLMPWIVRVSTEGFSSHEKADEIEQFFQANSVVEIERTVRQCVETIHAKAMFMEKNLLETTNWLKTHT